MPTVRYYQIFDYSVIDNCVDGEINEIENYYGCHSKSDAYDSVLLCELEEFKSNFWIVEYNKTAHKILEVYEYDVEIKCSKLLLNKEQ